MSIEIFKAFPPDRESAVAELNVRHDGTVDIPAEVFREDGELRINIFRPEGGVAWQYSVDEWVAAIQRAIEVLGPA
jgi:hypothetical protein